MKLYKLIPLGDKIRYYRKKGGLTQKNLAKLLNITEANISQLENGKRSPTQRTVEKLAAALGISPADLVPDWQRDCLPATDEPSPALQHLYDLSAQLTDADLTAVTAMVEALLAARDQEATPE